MKLLSILAIFSIFLNFANAQILDFGEEKTVSSDSIKSEYKKLKLHPRHIGIYAGITQRAENISIWQESLGQSYEGGFQFRQDLEQRHSFGLNVGFHLLKLRKDHFTRKIKRGYLFNNMRHIFSKCEGHGEILVNKVELTSIIRYGFRTNSKIPLWFLIGTRQSFAIIDNSNWSSDLVLEYSRHTLDSEFRIVDEFPNLIEKINFDSSSNQDLFFGLAYRHKNLNFELLGSYSRLFAQSDLIYTFIHNYNCTLLVNYTIARG